MNTPAPVEQIVLTDLRIPFFRLVVFFVKAAFALLTAGIIVGLAAMAVTAVLAVLFGELEIVMKKWPL